MSKEQQIGKGRMKPKKESKFGTSRAPIKKKRVTTDEELAYLNWSKEQDIPCWICGTLLKVIRHHVKRDSSDAKNHERIIPLCGFHHDGTVLSPHGTAVLFRNKFPMEIQEAYADSLYEEYLYFLRKKE